MNQLAAPGLGSLIAGKFISGSIQLLLSVTGFIFVILWFIQLMIFFYGLTNMGSTAEYTGNKIGLIGLLLFIFSWCWSLITSAYLIYKTRQNPLTPPPIKQQPR